MKSFKIVVHLVTVLSFFVVSLAWTPHPVKAAAAEITVNTPVDDAGTNLGSCSLREAIISANENKAFGGCTTPGTPGPDIIRIPASAAPYSLTILDYNQNDPDNDARTGDLDIREPVQIFGMPGNLPVISGSNSSRVFHILTNGSVQIKDLQITDGNVAMRGGGIYIDGDYGHTPTVIMTRVDLFKNTARGAGGGLFVGSGTTAYIFYSRIARNTAPDAGGVLNEGNLTLDSSLVINNWASSTVGGIHANTSSDTEQTRIVNTTIADNDQGDDSPVAGISVSIDAKIELINNTIVDNRGIGLEVKAGNPTTVTIRNTIIARQVGNNCSVPSGASFTEEYNITSDATCNFTKTGDQNVPVANLGLEPLTNNGGPTMTYALQESSPAVDAGTNNGCPSADQRLRGRPAVGKPDGSATCDIGAYERNGNSFVTYLSFIRR